MIVTDADRRPRRSITALVAVAAFAAGVLVGAVAGSSNEDPDGWVLVASAEDIRREGVTFVPEIRAFVVADPASATPVTLYARSPHRGGRIVYCESSTWFEDVAHGSKFDHLGRYVLGPSPRGLDRLPTEIRDGDVWIDANHIVLGPPRGGGVVEPPPGPFCTTGS